MIGRRRDSASGQFVLGFCGCACIAFYYSRWQGYLPGFGGRVLYAFDYNVCCASTHFVQIYMASRYFLASYCAVNCVVITEQTQIFWNFPSTAPFPEWIGQVRHLRT